MKDDDVRKEIRRIMENRKHYSNTNNPIDFPKIQAGADIHAGDGGYSIGTQEKYEEFAKARNKSLGKMRIRELAEQAGLEFDNDLALEPEPIYYTTQKDLEKFAELIVRDTLDQVAEFSRLTKAYQTQGIDPEIDVTKEVLKNFGFTRFPIGDEK